VKGKIKPASLQKRAGGKCAIEEKKTLHRLGFDYESSSPFLDPRKESDVPQEKGRTHRHATKKAKESGGKTYCTIPLKRKRGCSGSILKKGKKEGPCPTSHY